MTKIIDMKLIFLKPNNLKFILRIFIEIFSIRYLKGQIFLLFLNHDNYLEQKIEQKKMSI